MSEFENEYGGGLEDYADSHDFGDGSDYYDEPEGYDDGDYGPGSVDELIAGLTPEERVELGDGWRKQAEAEAVRAEQETGDWMRETFADMQRQMQSSRRWGYANADEALEAAAPVIGQTLNSMLADGIPEDHVQAWLTANWETIARHALEGSHHRRLIEEMKRRV